MSSQPFSREDPFTLTKTVYTKGTAPRELARVEIDFYPSDLTMGRQEPRCYIGDTEVDAETLNSPLIVCWVFAPMSDAGGIRIEEATRPLEDTQKPDASAGPPCG